MKTKKNLPKKIVYDFLNLFNLEKLKIFKNSKIEFDNFKNIILKDENLEKNKIQTKNILFLKFKDKNLPTIFFLDLIKHETKNFFEILEYKKAVNFSYSKDIIIQKSNLKHLKYYIILYDKTILGVGQYFKDQNRIKNIINIGEYLKEN